MLCFKEYFILKVFQYFSVLVFLFALFHCSQSAKPQDTYFGSLHGYAYDQTKNIPLSNVDIILNDSLYLAKTDSLGYYIIPKIEIGHYNLLATKPDYHPEMLNFTINKNDTTLVNFELEFNSEYWSIPQEDSFILFFRMSDNLKIDSTLAGQIQYRLDIARTFDHTLDSLFAQPSWKFGELIIRIPDSIYTGIDFETMDFNHYPIDSINSIYGLRNIKKLSILDDDKWLMLLFDGIYNMPILKNEYKQVDGIISASANGIGFLPEGPDYDIYLDIEDYLYKFEFYLNENYAPNAPYHFWEIHVVEDKIIYSDRY